MRRLVREMRVLQVVHRHDERDTPRVQNIDDLGELVRRTRIETEVDVKQIALAQPTTKIVGLQQARRPPLTGSGSPLRNRITEQRDDVAVDDRCHVRMGSGNRGDDHCGFTNQTSESKSGPGLTHLSRSICARRSAPITHLRERLRSQE